MDYKEMHELAWNDFKQNVDGTYTPKNASKVIENYQKTVNLTPATENIEYVKIKEIDSESKNVVLEVSVDMEMLKKSMRK